MHITGRIFYFDLKTSGLNVERGRNAPFEFYEVDRKDEKKGLMIYHLNKQAIQKEIQEAKTEEKTQRSNYVDGIKQGLYPVPQTMQVIMRLYVQYTSPYYLSFIQNGKEQNSINNYSFNHVAVLENQLRYPVPGRTMLSDFYEKYS